MNKKSLILLPALMMILASCGGNTSDASSEVKPSSDPTSEVTPSSETSSVDPTPSVDWVTEPVVGTKYHLGVNTKDSDLGSNYYVTGSLKNNYYGEMVKDPASAATVELVTAEGGYNVKVTKSDNSIVYLNLTVSGTHINVTYGDTATTVFTLNSTYSTLFTTAEDTEYYPGTYYSTSKGSTFNTLSYSKTSFLNDEKLDTSSFPARFYAI